MVSNDTFSLLNSLTMGVQNKVKGEIPDEEGIEYKVGTSIKAKRKRDLEESKSKQEETVLEAEVVMEGVPEEHFDTIDESFDKAEIEEVAVDDDLGESLIDDYTFVDNSDDKEELKEEDIDSDVLIADEKKETEKSKIDRKGNIFNRGGKLKKKEPVIDWKAEREKRKQEELEKKLKKSSSVETDDDLGIDDFTTDNEFSEAVENILDTVNEKTDIEFMEESIGGSMKELIEEPMEESIGKSMEEEVDSENFEELKVSEKIENVGDFENLEENNKDLETQKSLEESSEKDNQEDPYKWCKYTPGMSIEDFLRENHDYREAFFVEHFFRKEDLNRLVNQGIILFKKGLYRL